MGTTSITISGHTETNTQNGLQQTFGTGNITYDVRAVKELLIQL